MKTMPGLITILLMFMLFVCISIYGWRKEWFLRQLERHGESVQALVTGSSPSRVGAAHSPARLAYTFSYANQAYDGSCYINDLAQQELDRGDFVRVQFLPNHPDVNRPLDLANTSFYKVVRAGLIASTCIAVFCGSFFFAIILKLQRIKLQKVQCSNC